MTDAEREIAATPDGGEYVAPSEHLLKYAFGYSYKPQSIDQFHDQAMNTALNVPCAYEGSDPDDWCPSSVKYEGDLCPVHKPESAA